MVNMILNIRGEIMSENKRFVINNNGIWDNGKQLNWGELRDVLNELYEENVILKQADNLNQCGAEVIRLRKENEYLNSKVDCIKSLLKRVNCYIHDIELIIND